jgi:hypothetical protein
VLMWVAVFSACEQSPFDYNKYIYIYIYICNDNKHKCSCPFSQEYPGGKWKWPDMQSLVLVYRSWRASKMGFWNSRLCELLVFKIGVGSSDCWTSPRWRHSVISQCERDRPSEDQVRMAYSLLFFSYAYQKGVKCVCMIFSPDGC